MRNGVGRIVSRSTFMFTAALTSLLHASAGIAIGAGVGLFSCFLSLFSKNFKSVFSLLEAFASIPVVLFAWLLVSATEPVSLSIVLAALPSAYIFSTVSYQFLFPRLRHFSGLRSAFHSSFWSLSTNVLMPYSLVPLFQATRISISPALLSCLIVETSAQNSGGLGIFVIRLLQSGSDLSSFVFIGVSVALAPYLLFYFMEKWLRRRWNIDDATNLRLDMDERDFLTFTQRSGRQNFKKLVTRYALCAVVSFSLPFILTSVLNGTFSWAQVFGVGRNIFTAPIAKLEWAYLLTSLSAVLACVLTLLVVLVICYATVAASMRSAIASLSLTSLSLVTQVVPLIVLISICGFLFRRSDFFAFSAVIFTTLFFPMHEMALQSVVAVSRSLQVLASANGLAGNAMPRNVYLKAWAQGILRGLPIVVVRALPAAIIAGKFIYEFGPGGLAKRMRPSDVAEAGLLAATVVVVSFILIDVTQSVSRRFTLA